MEKVTTHNVLINRLIGKANLSELGSNLKREYYFWTKTHIFTAFDVCSCLDAPEDGTWIKWLLIQELGFVSCIWTSWSLRSNLPHHPKWMQKRSAKWSIRQGTASLSNDGDDSNSSIARNVCLGSGVKTKLVRSWFFPVALLAYAHFFAIEWVRLTVKKTSLCDKQK